MLKKKQSVCLHLSVCHSFFLYVSLFVCLFVYLYVFLFGVLFVCRTLPVCLSVCPSVRLAGCLSVRPSVCLSIPLSVCRLSFSLSVCLRVCLFLWDFPEIMMTNGWCDSIFLFMLQVFTAFSQTAACSALSVVTAKNTSRTDVSGASMWTHMGRISFLKFQRKDFTWEESEAITAPFLSKCYSYRKQRKQVPISSGIFFMGRLVCTLNDLTTQYERTREQRTCMSKNSLVSPTAALNDSSC